MGTILNQENIRYFHLGRHALHAGLQLLGVGEGDLVLVPAFICHDLLAPIHSLGAVPRFYEVNEQLQPVAFPDTEGVRAILAVNYFGFPQDLSPFRAYCNQTDAILIEDNAHGFLSHDETDTALGLRGDLGIFSMRKTLTMPDGGALVANKPEWQSLLPQQLPCRDEALPISYWTKRSLARMQRQTKLPLLTAGQALVRGVRRWRTGHEAPRASPESECQMPPMPAPHCHTLATLSRLDAQAEAARRRKLYQQFQVQLAALSVQPVFGDLPAGTVPYGYPFYADEKTAQAVAKLAHKQGLDCIHWPDLPEAVAPRALPHYRRLYLVNFL